MIFNFIKTLWFSWILFLFTACSMVNSGIKKENIPTGMVFIPGGSFIMGSSREEAQTGKIDIAVNEFPKKKVYIKAYYMDKYEIRNRDYAEFLLGAGKKHIPPEHYNLSKQPPYPDGQDEYAVVDVNWYAAKDYCQWKGKRLPTEEEWEKAARGADGRIYPWGNQAGNGKANTFEAKLGKVAAVGNFPGDISPFGVYDLSGNVSEWTGSMYKPYQISKGIDLEEYEGYAVVRGASFGDQEGKHGRGASRRPDPKTRYLPGLTWSGNLDLGFRCAMDLLVSK